MYERTGRIRRDIETRYVRSRDFAPTESSFWVQGNARYLERLQQLGNVRDCERGLFRVERAQLR
jgi:hypothetical protein